MLDRDHPSYLMLAPLVRARYRRITAFRMGFIAGELDRSLPPPYYDYRGRRMFVLGKRAARRWRIERPLDDRAPAYRRMPL